MEIQRIHSTKKNDKTKDSKNDLDPLEKKENTSSDINAKSTFHWNDIGKNCYESVKSFFDGKNDSFEPPDIPQSHKNNQISLEELEKKAETGDVILWRGESDTAKLIRFLTKSAFSHCTVLVRGTIERDGQIYGEKDKVSVFQATSDNFKEIINEQKVDAGTFKVQLTPINDNFKLNYQAKEYGVYFKLNLNDLNRKIIEDGVKDFASKTIGNEYDHLRCLPINIFDILKESEFHEKIKDKQRYICSDLVVNAYQKCGILPEKPLSMQYTPGSFCEEQAEQSEIYKKHFPIINKEMLKTTLEKGRFVTFKSGK